MVFSALTGRKTDESIMGVNEFVIDPVTREVSQCPAMKVPVFSSYDEKKELYHVKFSKETCAFCILFPVCPVQEQIRFNSLRFTEKKLQFDICRSLLGTERHKELADF